MHALTYRISTFHRLIQDWINLNKKVYRSSLTNFFMLWFLQHIIHFSRTDRQISLHSELFDEISPLRNWDWRSSLKSLQMFLMGHLQLWQVFWHVKWIWCIGVWKSWLLEIKWPDAFYIFFTWCPIYRKKHNAGPAMERNVSCFIYAVSNNGNTAVEASMWNSNVYLHNKFKPPQCCGKGFLCDFYGNWPLFAKIWRSWKVYWLVLTF